MTTKEQHLFNLTEETTNELVDLSVALFTAIQDENFEEAAKTRDMTSILIEQSAAMFAAMTGDSIDKFTKHFNQQVTYIIDQLTKKYGESK